MNNLLMKLLRFNKCFNEDCDTALLVLESLERTLFGLFSNGNTEAILKLKDILEEELPNEDTLPSKNYLLGRAHSVINLMNMYLKSQNIRDLSSNLVEIEKSILIHLDRKLEITLSDMMGFKGASPKTLHDSVSKLKVIGLIYSQRIGKEDFLYLSTLGKQVLNKLQASTSPDKKSMSAKAHLDFPPPLSQEEEAACVQLLKKGDDIAKNTLIERNLSLVAEVIKKFDYSDEDQDDLVSIGTIGLIKAINVFDPQKGITLATFIKKAIENEILMHRRVMKKVRSEVHLFERIGVDREGNEITLLDILGAHAQTLPETVDFDKKLLLENMSRLSVREKKVLELRFGLNIDDKKTQQEIARSLGISRSYVSRIERKALSKLARGLRQEEEEEIGSA